MIRTANKNEYTKVLQFYNQLIDDMDKLGTNPRWKKGLYPSPNDIQSAIENSELFIYEESDSIVAAMRVNQEGTEGYESVSWGVEASDDEIIIIHMLGVAIQFRSKGIARSMVQFVIDRARAGNQKAIRLDVLQGNFPAANLYKSMGFEYRDKISLFYESTGHATFEIYEFMLK